MQPRLLIWHLSFQKCNVHIFISFNNVQGFSLFFPILPQLYFVCRVNPCIHEKVAFSAADFNISRLPLKVRLFLFARSFHYLNTHPNIVRREKKKMSGFSRLVILYSISATLRLNESRRKKERKEKATVA